MSPYLTGQGRWLFATGACFLVVGALLREPLILAFAQIPFFVLIAALLSVLPAARAVDRRQCRFRVDRKGEPPRPMVLRKGRENTLDIWVENGSHKELRIVKLSPFVGGDLEVAVSDRELSVGPGRAECFDVELNSEGVGRSSLQGFDLVVTDRWGLVAARDYLPCLQVFVVYPQARFQGIRWKSTARPVMTRASRVINRRSRSGTDLRELREFQPGDPLRSVAWKATVRQRRLITREYDDERMQTEYLGLDISSSMRAGTPRGVKFEHAVQVVDDLTSSYLARGRAVGLWTFDTELYGEVDARQGRHQRRRIQRHLVGLKTVVSEGRTLLDSDELQEALADYLLVQERLDFRRGGGLRGEVDGQLLRRWLLSQIYTEEKLWGGADEAASVLERVDDPVRRFFRLRALPLDPPAEIEGGAKITGFRQVLESMLRKTVRGGRLTMISDLCSLSGVEILDRLVKAAHHRGTEIRVLAPFTPYYGRASDDPEGALIFDIFTRAERKDRLQVARRLKLMGISVRFFGPGHRSVLL